MLSGKKIWITRPGGQAVSLESALADAGAKVRLLPMMAIRPLPLAEEIRQTVLALDRYDLLIFISTNAASIGMEIIHDYWPQFPVKLGIYSVGPTTAQVIESYGLKAEFPAERMSSEALLALDALSEIDGKRALIVRGVGGREVLAEQLRERGASVDYLELYQRISPDYDAGELAGLVGQEAPDAVVVTSAQALENMTALLRSDSIPLDAIPLFVSSERIAQTAADSGYPRAISMSGADDKAIIGSLETHLS